MGTLYFDNLKGLITPDSNAEAVDEGKWKSETLFRSFK
jgi:hypothetical protein